jgi:hypothetical protein
VSLEVKLAPGEEGLAVSSEQGDPASNGFEVDERGAMTVRDLRVTRWQAGIVRGESIRDLDRGVVVTPHQDRIEVRNGTPFELRAISVRGAGGIERLDRLAPGASATLSNEERRAGPDAGALAIAASDAARETARATLDRRAALVAQQWVASTQGSFALAAFIDLPPVAGRSPEPNERAALILVGP